MQRLGRAAAALLAAQRGGALVAPAPAAAAAAAHAWAAAAAAAQQPARAAAAAAAASSPWRQRGGGGGFASGPWNGSTRALSSDGGGAGPLAQPSPLSAPAAAPQQSPEQPLEPQQQPEPQPQQQRAAAQRDGPIEGVCRRRNIKLGWKKLDFVLRMVRRSYVDDALAQLSANPKKAATYVLHAVANARNNALCAGAPDAAALIVAEAFATKGKLGVKRVAIMGRGNAGIKESRLSHLNVRVRALAPGDADAVAAAGLRRPPRLVSPLLARQHARHASRRRAPPAGAVLLDV
ncbi:mrpl22 [Scenedesmus sp. PABB004]|nr:mrpl22 [Scenedesmus sp. PABB004]